MSILCSYVIALHSCQITFKALKPNNKAYPKELNTLGDHLRKIRLDRNQTQPQIAKRFGVCLTSIINWEKNIKQPRQTQAAQIIEYLGYIPYDFSELKFAEQVRLARTIGGYSLEEFAKQFDCDASNLSKIELGKRKPTKRIIKKLVAFIKDRGIDLNLDIDKIPNSNPQAVDV